MNPKNQFTQNLSSATGGFAANPLFMQKKQTPKPTTTPSNTSATSPATTKITSPAGQDYIQSQLGSIKNQALDIQSKIPTATTPEPSYKDSPDYKSYLAFQREKENPSEASDARSAYQASLTRLAEAQTQRETRSDELRREQRDILDASGGLKSGAIDSANMKGRRANDELSRLALEESAAARSAGVASDTYSPYLEQEQANKKALTYEEALGLGVPFGTTLGEAKALGKVPLAPDEAEGFTLGKDQVRYDKDGNVIARGSTSTDTGSIGTYTPGENPVVDSWVDFVNKGGDISKVPDDYKNAVAQGIFTSGKNEVSQGAKDMIATIDDLLADKDALLSVTGPIQKIRPDFLTSGKGILAKNKIDQLIASLQLEERQKLKGSGAISDFEFRILGQSATAINKNLAETEIIKELTTLKDKLSGNAPIPTTPTEGDLWKAPDGIEYEFKNGGWESFNEVGNTTVSIPQSSRLAYVNNNPGNLRFAGQTGATQGEGGFARFSTPEAGVQALEKQIKLDASRGLTLAQFINKYAPPSENDTQKYIQDMIALTGATPLTPLSSIDTRVLTKAIAQKESSTNIA